VNKITAKAIAGRMRAAWGVEKNGELARFIGGHKKMMGNWINAGAIPREVFYTGHLQTGCSLDWLYNSKLPLNTARHQITNNELTIMLNLKRTQFTLPIKR
jgi:hypothetical protein